MLSEWLFIPRSWEYGVPWVLGSILSFTLGLFGLPALRKFEASLPQDIAIWGLAGVGLLVLNGIALWIHVRTQFLTFRTMWRHYVGTYIVMTSVFVVIFGVVSIARDEIDFTIRDANFEDTTRAAVMALSAISLSWGVSATQFFKTEDTGAGGVRQRRRNALKDLKELLDDRLTAKDVDRLVGTLKRLSGDADAAASSLSEEQDRNLASNWKNAAETLHNLLEGLSPKDFREIRKNIESDLSANIAQLQKTA